MDFSKAFVKVNYNGLIKTWLIWSKSKGENVDSNKSQAVILQGEGSHSGIVIAGVPQGYVIGPWTVLIYIYDLLEGKSSTVKLFADDTIVYLTINKWNQPKRPG